MISAPRPPNEAERLAELRAYEVLDTGAEGAFDNIVHIAASVMDAPISIISLTDAERQWFKARVGREASQCPREISFCAHAINTPGEVMVVPDTRLDARFADNPLVLGDPLIRFYAGAPLVNPRGLALGTLCVVDREPRAMSEENRDILRRLAETVMTTLELRRAVNRARDLALMDALTGLPNRLAMIDAIERAIAGRRRHGLPFALLYLDLDGFKRVNDLHGHATGDSVLKEVASTLRGALRRDDTAGRLGGDEFGVVLPGSESETIAVAERVRQAIGAGLVGASLAAGGYGVTASIGVVSFRSIPADADRALALADGLMYAAKAAGKNRVVNQVV